MQAEMQDRCGISGATWSNYENGVSEPSIWKLLDISKMFGVGVEELLTVDFENVHLSTKNGGEIKEARSTPKSTPNSTPFGQKILVGKPPTGAENEENDEEKLTAWVVLTHLKKIEGKIDSLRVYIEKPPI